MGKPAVLSVRIITDAKDGKKGLSEYSGAVGEFQGKVENSNGALSRLGGFMAGVGKAAKIATGIVAGLGAAVVAIAIKGGIDRALAIENAQAKLTGLGHSAQTVTGVMDSALAAVKGTAFGLGDAASIAANMVAAGVKPGQDLTRSLRLVADAATIGGVSLGEMGSIFGKVAAGGKVTTNVMDMLSERGISSWDMLSKSMGKTVPEIQKMVSAGEISFAQFQDAMEQGMGGAALKSGATTTGAFNNMMAALSRWGESLISGVFPLAKQFFGGITGFLDDLTTKTRPAMEAFSASAGQYIGPVLEGIVAFLSGFVLPAIEAFGAFLGTYIIPAIIDFGTTVFEAFSKAFTMISGFFTQNQDAGAGFADLLGGVITVAVKILAETLATLITIGAGLTVWILENRDWLLTLGAAVLGGVVAFKAIQAAAVAYQGVLAVGKGITTAYGIAQTAVTTGLKAYRSGMTLASAVQVGFNTVVAANPIMIMVIAIAALVAGIIYAYNNVGWFKDGVDAAFSFIGQVVGNVAQWFQDVWNGAITVVGVLWQGLQITIGAVGQWFQDTFGPLIEWFQMYWDAGMAALGKMWQDFQNTVGAVSRFIEGIVGNVVRFFQDAWDGAVNTVIGVWQWLNDTAKTVLTYIRDLVGNVSDWFNQTLGGALNGAGETGRRALGWIVDSIKNVIDWVKNAIDWFGSLFGAANKSGEAARSARGGTALVTNLFPELAGTGIMNIGATNFLTTPPRWGNTSAQREVGNTVINITVNGAIDTYSTAQQIRDILAKSDRGMGRIVVA